jgi:hypothetical protein
VNSTKPFDIQIEGVEEYVFALDRFGEYVEFLGKDTWEEIAGLFFDNEKKIFDNEGDPNRFSALSPKYAEWKQNNYGNLPIMQLSGRSKTALTGKGSFPGHAVPVKKIISRKNAQGITVGVRSPFLYAHQYGIPPLPKREVIQVTVDLKLKYVKVLQKALAEARNIAFAGGGAGI